MEKESRYIGRERDETKLEREEVDFESGDFSGSETDGLEDRMERRVAQDAVQIEKARRELVSDETDSDAQEVSEADLRLNTGKPEERIVRYAEEEYRVVYVPRESIYPAFGYADDDGVARVREDLSPSVRRFVTEHELYHLKDKAKWGGWIGREMRANFWPALRDPVGFFATAVASLNRDRLKFYWERFRRGY